MNNKKRKKWDFYETRVGKKNVKEKMSAHITFQTRLKLVNVMSENSCDVLGSDHEPSCSRIEQLKGKKCYLIRFLEDIKSHREEGECHKRSLTPCKTPPKISLTPTKYAACISLTDIL